MALSTVTVTWDEEDVGAGALGGYVSFQLTADLQDQADGIDVRRNPARTVFFAGPSGSSPPLVANDNAVTPAGTAYVITVAIQGQAPVTFTSQINHANGATQSLAFLQANAALPSVQYAQFLPLPSGTAAAGNVPVATGAGSASSWGAVAAVLAPSGDTTGAADTAAINAAAQAGRVAWLQAGATYYITNLLPDSLGGIDGNGAVLQAVPGATGYAIALKAPASTYQVTIRNLTVKPASGQGGVHLDNTGFTAGGGVTDSLHVLENVYVNGGGGTGFLLDNNVRSLRMTGCASYSSGGDGCYVGIGCTDSFFTACDMGASAGHNWNVPGWNNMFAACKGFYAGWNGSAFSTSGNCWEVTGKKNTLSACSGQNGALHGANLNGAVACTLIGFEADHNSSGPGTTGAGVNTSGATYCTVTGAVGGNDGGETQKYGIQVAGTQTGTLLFGNTVTGTSGPLGYVSGGGYTQVDGSTADLSGVGLVKLPSPSYSAAGVQALSSSGSIATGGAGIIPVTETANVTGMALATPPKGNTEITVVNRSNFTVTFAASGASNVADGTGDVIPALAARKYVFDSGTSLWYRMG